MSRRCPSSRVAGPVLRWAPVCARLALAVALAATLGCSGARQDAPAGAAGEGDLHYRLADGNFHAGRVDLAIRELVLALAAAPDHADAHYLYGFILFGRKQFDEAAEHFRRAQIGRAHV